ncbi:MAG TPA: TPM domain-containing protein [Ktedonobacterales bacterium]|nr:TPM domain-containing protein [Ktedonobacterales bacterium]
MTTRRRYAWQAILFAPVLLALAMALASFPGAAHAAPAAGDGCLGPVAGQRVYDCANLLTPEETTDLEQQAAAVAQAGAPTVVYLQARPATAEQTLQDAIDLMNRWNVESKPGARDGFVMFFNLQPDDLRHGQVALYAGEKHVQHGNLPQAELDRIRTDVMTPLLQNGQTTAGIAAGLQMVAHDLRYGPPPPPASQTVSAAIGRLPFALLGILFAIVVAILYERLRRQAPIGGASGDTGLNVLSAEDHLAPAMAGALVNGRVSDAQIEATMLDFARRGLLVMEPAGADKVQVRLVGDGAGLVGFEQELWNELTIREDPETRILSREELAAMRTGWGQAKALLRRDLIERGWYDPEAAAARRRPLYIAGAIGVGGALLGVILLLLSKEAWAVIGVALFAASGVAAFVRGYAIPDTTVEGEMASVSWRAYRDTVSDSAYEPNLDTDLPYIVALGILGKLAPRLKAASERGYSPAWFRPDESQRDNGQLGWATGFYPYWMLFHTSMTPTSSGSGSASGSYSGGYSGGGAAGGGGGSAGGF